LLARKYPIDGNFRSQKAKSGTVSCLLSKYLPLFHHFKAVYQFPKHIFFFVKIVANASLDNFLIYYDQVNDIYLVSKMGQIIKVQRPVSSAPISGLCHRPQLAACM
jgi:hypothetical protein